MASGDARRKHTSHRYTTKKKVLNINNFKIEVRDPATPQNLVDLVLVERPTQRCVAQHHLSPFDGACGHQMPAHEWCVRDGHRRSGGGRQSGEERGGGGRGGRSGRGQSAGSSGADGWGWRFLLIHPLMLCPQKKHTKTKQKGHQKSGGQQKFIVLEGRRAKKEARKKEEAYNQ